MVVILSWCCWCCSPALPGVCSFSQSSSRLCRALALPLPCPGVLFRLEGSLVVAGFLIPSFGQLKTVGVVGPCDPVIPDESLVPRKQRKKGKCGHHTKGWGPAQELALLIRYHPRADTVGLDDNRQLNNQRWRQEGGARAANGGATSSIKSTLGNGRRPIQQGPTG